jgi:hypothetical protein
MKSSTVLLCYIFFAFLIASQGLAQQPTPAPTPETQPGSQPLTPEPTPSNPTVQPSPSPTPDDRSQPDREKELQKKEQSQRILGVVPQFGVTRQDAKPLTTGQKFHLFAKSSFDPFQYAAAGLQAGLGQATNEFPGYGQGAVGYGKRYGASLADEVSSNFFANFLYPTLLKEDPRYFRLGEGSIRHRIGYSLAQEFVTHTDKGMRRFNFSNALGAFSSGGLSNIYYPATDRGLGLTMSRSAISLLYGSAGGLVDEFWPDIDRKLFHRKSHEKVPKAN